MARLFIFILLLLPSVALARPAYLEWFNTVLPNKGGQALIIHGLNTKPEKMSYLIKEINDRGHDVLLVRLKGHNEDLEEMKKVTKDTWLRQVDEAFTELAKRGEENKGSVTFFAHSLGAVLGTSYLASHPLVKVDQMVLFAPALKVKFTSKFIKALFGFPDGFIVPSMTPINYRAQRGTTIAAYKALFDTISFFEAADLAVINVPTTVIMDPEDELVSFPGIQGLVGKQDKWKLLTVSTKGSVLPKPYHHLIISGEALGFQEWEDKVLRTMDSVLGKKAL